MALFGFGGPGFRVALLRCNMDKRLDGSQSRLQGFFALHHNIFVCRFSRTLGGLIGAGRNTAM